MMLKAVDDWKTEWFFDVAKITHEGVMHLDSLDVVNCYYKNVNSNILQNIEDVQFVGLGDPNCLRDFGYDVCQEYHVTKTDGQVLTLAVCLRHGPPDNGFWLLNDDGDTVNRLASYPGSEAILSYQESKAEELKVKRANSNAMTMENA